MLLERGGRPEDVRAGLFVGRGREVAGLCAMVRDRPLVVVTGPSGVGESSLVAAGLAPGLLTDGRSVASFRPGAGLTADRRAPRPGSHPCQDRHSAAYAPSASTRASWLPSSLIRPFSTTAITSASCAVCSRWAIATTVRPSSTRASERSR